MFDKFKAKISEVDMEKHLGTVKELMQKHLGPKVQEIANDPVKLADAFKQVYPFLPMPVRLVVSEEKFVEFGVSHKDQILSASGA